MRWLLPRLSAEFPFLNQRAATEDDFYEACGRHKIKVVLTHDVRTGLFIKIRDEQFIFINSKLRGLQFLHVAFHELAHTLFHAPSRSVVAEFFDIHYRRRHEREAEAVAALLLIPLQDAIEFVSNPELVHDNNLAELVHLRLELFNRGIQ